MSTVRPPDHLRRARLARRARFAMGLVAGGFVVYRIAAVFVQ